MKTLLFVIGTRPEAIKLSSVIQASRNNPRFRTLICVTNQHTDLLTPFLKRLRIEPDYSFAKGNKGDSLHETSAQMLLKFQAVFPKSAPDLVIVQGDTTSAFVAALSAHYANIPVAHVEAGLRTNNLFAPWPEESHRRMIDQISSYCFVPTDKGRETLLGEGISKDKIWMVGNTAIDALSFYQEEDKREQYQKKQSIVVTIHRRENHGKPLLDICQALRRLCSSFPELEISFFLHPNPEVRKTVKEALNGIHNIKLRAPCDHFSFITFIKNASFILTDSGGIQEEAPYLGIPVLIARSTTERPEGIAAQTARLVGTCPETIVTHCTELLESTALLESMSKVHYPYGRGDSGKQIISRLSEALL